MMCSLNLHGLSTVFLPTDKLPSPTDEAEENDDKEVMVRILQRILRVKRSNHLERIN